MTESWEWALTRNPGVYTSVYTTVVPVLYCTIKKIVCDSIEPRERSQQEAAIYNNTIIP